MLVTHMLPLLFLDGLLDTLNELNFVIRVMLFSYLLFWCYMTFRDAQILFGLASIVAGYFVFLHGLSVTVLVLIFMIFVVLGQNLQMLFQFGIMPIFGYHSTGVGFAKAGSMEKEQFETQNAMQAITAKINQGTATQEEANWLANQNVQQQMQGQDSNQQNRLRPH